jgi:hypothetical protein
MDDGRHEERFQQYEEILRSLTAMLASQQLRNERQDTINERLAVAIEELKVINVGVQTTLARIETLLARMLRHEDNGRDA